MKNEIGKIIKLAVKGLFGDSRTDFSVDYPQNEKFGDYSSNMAMVLAKKLGKNPLEIAENIKSGILKIGNDNFSKIEIAKPGYINFYLSDKYWQKKVGEINRLEDKFGESVIGKGVKINNEFISANPTGPLHLGNGRGGFYGDTLSKVFKKSGYEVTNEYYVNDGGGQVEKLGHSVLKDNEAVYAGEYIEELNEKFGRLSLAEAGEKSAKYILENIIKPTVEEKMKIGFDVWVSEKKEIIGSGLSDKAVEFLKNKKVTYEKDSALWLATSKLGDDKDRVLVKSDGKNAYLASDCGYFLHKIERNFQKIILILGADHHGYVPRMRAAAQMLGFQGELKFIIVQLVRLVKKGKEVRMSKRAGTVIYIDELIDKVGHDVARFFFLMYSPDTHMNFDLGLAEERSQKNPVYYVQYAHARISSIMNKVSGIKYYKKVDLSLLKEEKELSLIKELNKFPEIIQEISASYEVHKLPHYAIKLADKFHSFYNAIQVIDKDNPELTQARLKLVNAVRIVLKETLTLIGVEAPEKM